MRTRGQKVPKTGERESRKGTYPQQDGHRAKARDIRQKVPDGRPGDRPVNNRPKKMYDYLKPNEVLAKAIENNGIVAFIT